MPWCSVRFPSRVTGSIQVHWGQNKKEQQNMACSFPLNAPGRCESEVHKKIQDDEDKKEEIWPSPMTKAPTPTEMSKGQVTTQTTPQKSSIKQRLRTDLGRSAGVTKATQLVWFTGLRAHLPTNRNSRVIKRTHI